VAIKPLADRVLVEPSQEEEKVGALYIPDTAKEKPSIGTIVAVGEGAKEGDKITPLSVKKGDKILYGKYSGTEVKDKGKDYLIIRESDILAVIE
jgi:chaperonin GroES